AERTRWSCRHRSTAGRDRRPSSPAAAKCYLQRMVNQPAPPVPGEAEFWAGVANAQRFFMGNAEVQYALQKLTAVLDAAGIPYAIAGAMALNHYGYRR